MYRPPATETFTATRERAVLVGMITDDAVLARVAARWGKDPFPAAWANRVGGWCVEHFRKHGKAPRRGVQSLFAGWAERNGHGPEEAQAVEAFLVSLSDEYDRTGPVNADYLVDEAGQLFNRTALTRLRDRLTADLEAADTERAEAAVMAHRRVELGAQAWVDPFVDEGLADRLFAESARPLFTYPGDLGRFFGDALERDGFLAFMAPDKSGKSYWLQDVAWAAMGNRCRVAFFAIGDMSERQMLGRFYVRAAAHPLRPGRDGWPARVKRPTKISPPPQAGAAARVQHAEVVFADPVSNAQVRKAIRRVRERVVKSKESYLRLSCHPSDTLTAAGVRGVLADWEVQGWVADVVVLDYADVLAPPAGVREVRDQINHNWKQLRSLSQEKHCLVVTATQSDAEAYDRDTLSRRNFSEDKRKLSHVTGMVGINVTAAEKDLGLCRLNWIVKREGEFNTYQCLHVAGCPALADPAVLATF